MSKDPPLFFYRALIRPIIEYGMEVYFNSAEKSLQLVKKIQNDSLRLCSGALQITTNNCLLHHCNEMPMKIKFEQLCVYNRAHLYTFTLNSDHSTSAVIKHNW